MGGRGTLPRAPNHYGAPKSPNHAKSTFFNTVHLLPQDLGFEHGGRQTCFLSRGSSNLVTPLTVAQGLGQNFKILVSSLPANNRLLEETC